MSLTVQLTDDALRDLDDIHAFVTAADGLARADQLVDGIGAALTRLSTLPERGESQGVGKPRHAAVSPGSSQAVPNECQVGLKRSRSS